MEEEMTDTVNHKNIYAALAAAQTAMTPVTKGAINPAFKGEGKPKGTPYVNLADVVGAVRPVLAANGICFFHQIIDGSIMRTSLVHGATETRIDCDVPLIVAKNDMQGMKSATTYAKRVGLESVTGVAPEDDDGNAAAKAPPPDTSIPDAHAAIAAAETTDALAAVWRSLPRHAQGDAGVIEAKESRKTALALPGNADLDNDKIPY